MGDLSELFDRLLPYLGVVSFIGMLAGLALLFKYNRADQ